MPRVKFAPVFYKGKRIATLQNMTYRISSNDTQELADSGPYNTDGTTVTEGTCDVIVPVAGIGVSVVRDTIDHKDVDISIGIVDGKIHEVKECRIKTVEVSGESASGKLTGKFDWHGGKPTVTG